MEVSFAVNIQKYTAIYGQASGVPPPSRVGRRGGGGGGWRVRRVVWPVGWGAAVGGQRGPGSYASHKLYNVGRVPVLINLNLYLIL